MEQTGEEIPFGKLEGMAVYLYGINLSAEVYENSDTAAIASLIMDLIAVKHRPLRYWEGNTETALYFYGKSFTEMKRSIASRLAKQPECENARIVQTA